jgi:hypothetical protein
MMLLVMERDESTARRSLSNESISASSVWPLRPLLAISREQQQQQQHHPLKFLLASFVMKELPLQDPLYAPVAKQLLRIALLLQITLRTQKQFQAHRVSNISSIEAI